MNVRQIHVHHQFQNASTHLVLSHVVVLLDINHGQFVILHLIHEQVLQVSVLNRMETKTV